MKHILDSSFQYKPSFATDLRKTFERVRKQQRAETRTQAKPASDIKVVTLPGLKKAGQSQAI
ncbi:MAG: hypothetical protein ACT4P4_21980 [Betaproteobacteria bacterium]